MRLPGEVHVLVVLRVNPPPVRGWGQTLPKSRQGLSGGVFCWIKACESGSILNKTFWTGNN